MNIRKTAALAACLGTTIHAVSIDDLQQSLTHIELSQTEAATHSNDQMDEADASLEFAQTSFYISKDVLGYVVPLYLNDATAYNDMVRNQIGSIDFKAKEIMKDPAGIEWDFYGTTGIIYTTPEEYVIRIGKGVIRKP